MGEEVSVELILNNWETTFQINIHVSNFALRINGSQLTFLISNYVSQIAFPNFVDDGDKYWVSIKHFIAIQIGVRRFPEAMCRRSLFFRITAIIIF